jgi:hypothetical protein
VLVVLGEPVTKWRQESSRVSRMRASWRDALAGEGVYNLHNAHFRLASGECVDGPTFSSAL